MSNERYELNEKDIDKVFEYLQKYHPNIATPEMAVQISEAMLAQAHKAAHGEFATLDDAMEEALKTALDKKDH